MSFAVDLALLVDFVTAGGDDLGFQRQIAAGDADAVELQLEISLTPEVTGILGGFEVTDEVAATREGLLSELSDSAKVTRTGSPTSTVAEEKLGSLRVHCKRVPAGRTTSLALAPRLRRTTRPSRLTARATWTRRNFILHLGRTPQIVADSGAGSAL